MKYQHKIVLFLLILIAGGGVASGLGEKNGLSKPEKLTSINLELLGNAMGYSLNFDRLSLVNEKFAWSYRLGFSYFPSHWFAFPLELNGLRGKNGHYFEVGLGILPNFEVPFVPLSKSIIVNYRVGYRFQKPNSRFMFRIATTPADFVNFNRKHEYREFIWQPCFGVTFGYSFDPYRKARNKPRVRFRASPIPNK